MHRCTACLVLNGVSGVVQCRVMFLFALVLGIGSTFHYGFQLSSVSSPSKFIKSFINDTWQHRYNTSIGGEKLTLVWSTIVSVFSLGGLLGSVMSGFFLRKYGKWRCLLFNNLLMMGTSLIMGFSKMAGSFEMIMIGRFLYGFNAGFGVNMGMSFLAEIAPMKFRGLINTSATIFITLGKLFGQVFGLRETLGREDLWPLLLSISGITALLQSVVFPFCPDTPPNLFFIKKDKEGCIKAMKTLWGEGDYKAEIEELIKEQNKRKSTKAMTMFELLRDKSLRLQLCMIVLLLFTAQLSGFNAIYFYTYDVFLQAGFTDDLIPYISVGVSACELLGTILCSILIEKLGRKVLLLSGYGVMVIALGLLTVTLSFQNSYSWIPYCSIALVFVYTLSCGLGPIGVTIVIMVEVLSHSARASGFSLVASLNWFGLYIIAMIFPYVVNSLQHFCFLIFMGFLLICCTLLFLLLPETKGKSFTAITEEFDRIRYTPICCRATVQEKEPVHIICTKL